MLVKINSKNVKDLSGVGVSTDTIRLLENAQKSGNLIAKPEDLVRIGVATADIELIKIHGSFSPQAEESEIMQVAITTDPKGLYDFLLQTDVIFKDKISKTHFNRIAYDGKVRFEYDNKVADSFQISVKAPNGQYIESTVSGKTAITHNVLKKDIEKLQVKIIKNNAVIPQPPRSTYPQKIKGRLISGNTPRKKEKIKIIFFVATEVNEEGVYAYYPVCFADTETEGYFFSSILTFRNEEDYRNILKAKAVLALPGNPEIDIRLEYKDAPAETEAGKLGRLPEKVILFLEQTGTEIEDKDCGCSDLNFHEKKVLEEFNYYSVVRTTEPLIKANEIKDVVEVNLEDITEDIVDDPVIRKQIAGLRLPIPTFKEFVSKKGIINKANVQEIIDLSKLHTQLKKINSYTAQHKGRVTLDLESKVDWDENPTIYEAVTIAHGHLLHFKQEWYADGYSLGDLLYSLPLAPGQKKQIVVFDWDRKDSASNTQKLDYQESLYNSLSRDRDINEIAQSTVSEKGIGGSVAGVQGGGSGIGGIVGGLILGAAGGFGIAGSIAGQYSSRKATASSQQQVHDRTVQAASSVRSQRSTVIQTVSQGERFEVSAEVVANYNHCHAMTIQYFEVIRHFEITTRLANVQECLFIPLSFSPFTRRKVLRWREILSSNIPGRTLRKGFAAIERIENEMESGTENYYDEIGFPSGSYAQLPLTSIEGEMFIEFQLQRPEDKQDDNGVWGFLADAWSSFTGFLGGILPGDFYDRFIKNSAEKDRLFYENAGPDIAQNLIGSLGFYAVKRGGATVELPIDATLLSGFRHKKPLNVSIRMEGDFVAEIKRENIDFIEIRIKGDPDRLNSIADLMRAGVRMIVHSGSVRYRTDLSDGYLFRNAILKNDLTPEGDNVTIFTPLSHAELREPIKEDVEACNSLLHHLNENLEIYHQLIWQNMDAQRRFMLLDGFLAPGKGNGRSVASVVENKLIGIVGNCLVMPVAPGFQLDPTLDEDIDLYQHYYEDPMDPAHVSLPTKGVFAEAVMGKCNSCEKKDETRFWRWEESPIPDSPTTINPINTPVPQVIQPNLQVKDFPAPIINMQNAPAIPDPQGYGALTTLLSNPNLFRDLTGLSENQKSALNALQTSLSSAGEFAGYALKSQELSNQLEAAKMAKNSGIMSEDQVNKLIEAVRPHTNQELISLMEELITSIHKLKEEGKISENTVKEASNEIVKDTAKAISSRSSLPQKNNPTSSANRKQVQIKLSLNDSGFDLPTDNFLILTIENNPLNSELQSTSNLYNFGFIELGFGTRQAELRIGQYSLEGEFRSEGVFFDVNDNTDLIAFVGKLNTKSETVRLTYSSSWTKEKAVTEFLQKKYGIESTIKAKIKGDLLIVEGEGEVSTTPSFDLTDGESGAESSGEAGENINVREFQIEYLTNLISLSLIK